MSRRLAVYAFAIYAVSRFSGFAVCAEDPVGWAVIANPTEVAVDLRVHPINKPPRNVHLNPGAKIWLTDSHEYEVSFTDKAGAWTLDATPGDKIAVSESDQGFGRWWVPSVGREARFPLTAWQVRYYHVARDGRQLRIAKGVPKSVATEFAKEYREEIASYGLDWRQLPRTQRHSTSGTAPRDGRRTSEALDSAYRDLIASTIETLLEKHLDATPRSWRGVEILPDLYNSDGDGAESRAKAAEPKITLRLLTHASPSPEAYEFCRTAVAMAIGVRTDEVRFGGCAAAPTSGNARLNSTFVDARGEPIRNKVRDSVLNELQRLGIPIELPISEQEDLLEFTAEWKHGAAGVPAAFENASIRSRIRVRCTFRLPSGSGNFRMPPSVDVVCHADIETKARSADSRKFRRLTSFDGFSISHFVPPPPSVGTPPPPGKTAVVTIEDQVWAVESAILRVLFGSHEATEDGLVEHAPPPPSDQQVLKPVPPIIGINFHVCKGGIHIDSVAAGTAATRCRDTKTNERIALEDGDHITAVDGTKVESEAHFRKLVGTETRLVLTVRDSRNGRFRMLVVDLE